MADHYPNVSLFMQQELSTSTVDCMSMIEELDRTALLLSRKLTRALERLDCSSKVEMLEKSAALKRHIRDNKIEGAMSSVEESLSQNEKELLRQRRAFFDEVQHISNMKKMLELLSAKKIELAIRNYDIVDLNIKTIDSEISLIERVLLQAGIDAPRESVAVTGAVLSEASEASSSAKKSKKKTQECASAGESAAENEPVYCICQRMAFGDMIACDNEDCPIEWFHYPCVNITRKPKNQWICHLCSNKRKK